MILEINRNGEGKEFYKNGKLQFEGKYVNGKRWKGKEYNIIGNLLYNFNYGTGRGKE